MHYHKAFRLLSNVNRFLIITEPSTASKFPSTFTKSTSLWRKGNNQCCHSTSVRCRSCGPSTQDKLPRVYLFTKENCSLCDKALEDLKPISHKFVLEKVDITLPENKDWFELYKYDIPVFHIYEEFICKHRADLDAFETALRKYPHGYKPVS